MRRCRLLILTAIYPEARAIARAFHLDESPLGSGLAFSDNISLGIAGIRARRLPGLIADVDPELLIMTGLAGALAPDLAVGDVVLDAPLPPCSPRTFALREGRIHTAHDIVPTPAAKAALYRETGALAVDMETAIAAEYAQKRGIPFHALRAISDAANHPLDPRLFALVDAQGHPRPARVAAYLVTGPWRLPGLLRIGSATKVALTNLTAVLHHFAMTSWPDKRQAVGPLANPVTSPQKS